MVNRFQALQSNTASGSTGSDTDAATTPSEGSDHDADVEFPRRLQEEEDRIHYQRMLQMAGIGDHIHGAVDMHGMSLCPVLSHPQLERACA